ncbi:MAG: 30S ribosomal protein S20 [Candidatus Auribacterota bacterium]|nr:30S ribosomal protein S20 [Candidatus Auribacterota bacterium]
MPSSKSAFKRMRSNEKKRMINKVRKSGVKTILKKTIQAISDKDADAVKQLLPQVFSKLDKAAKSGVIHKNNINRKKSFITKLASTVLSEKE